MGFSISGSAALFIIATFMAAGMMAATLTTGIDSVTEALDATGESRLERQNTDISITSLTYDEGTSTLTIETDNTRSTALTVSDTDILVDNSYVAHADLSISVDGDNSTDLWLPGETMRIEHTTTPTPSNVTVVAGNGIRDSGVI